MMARTVWHTEDFESLSWHDVHVHGIRLACFDETEGTADLQLDIDYILKWERRDEFVLFTVCPAELTFHDTFRLKFALDYATPTAGMCPFSIHDIRRETLEVAAGCKSFRWCIQINWPHGSLELEASGFTLRLVGTPVTQASQCLLSDRRRGAE